MTYQPRHFIDLADLDQKTLQAIIDHAILIKSRRGANRFAGPDSALLAGRMVALFFEQPSTRTRISFDLAGRELGAQTLLLAPQEMHLVRGESIKDTALTISRYVDAIMLRMLDHQILREFSQHCSIPVINGLTQMSHPCQLMADIMTYQEHRGAVAGKKFAWCGDVNNMLVSLAEASGIFGFALSAAVPREISPDTALTDRIKRANPDIEWRNDAIEAVRDADCVITDTWQSLVDDALQRDAPEKIFMPFQVSEELMEQAKPDALFMHCLPAHRGQEVTDAVIDGPQSVVWDEAENRMHVQKAILAYCMGCELR